MKQSVVDELVQQAVELINKARYLVIFTGAGISTPSGIPDFRGEKEGLWQRYDPMRVASRTAFLHTPGIFYDWFRPLFVTSWTAQPNPAHMSLAELEKVGIVKSIITQNIDGLHQKAGSRHVSELHGSALTFSCPSCHSSILSEIVFHEFVSGTEIPLCPQCKTVIKPNVVLFEEPLPVDAWQEAEHESSQADLILVIGSALEVYPASTIPHNAALRGCKILINNLTVTPLNNLASLFIPLDAADFIPKLAEKLL
jgi:NAD-dependent deacetylase